MKRSTRGARAAGALASALLLALLGAPALGAEEGSPEASENVGPRKDLLEDSTRRDIAGASYYELLAWCRELRLTDSGDRNALQGRLLRHFGLKAEKAAEREEPRVRIVSAGEIRYYTLEEVGESYVELTGGVVVIVGDKDRDATHRIEAESLLYNQTTEKMTASGGARYVLSREGGKEEVFSGESLSFDTNTLEGVFYGGSVQRERTVDGKALEFTIEGETMSRLENDTVIVENGSMTSSDAEDPYYRIRAKRAWLLATGEWAARGVTLEVGRVPLFYMPFFFYPGDQFIFHPSIAFRTREGTAVQTTTYLIGQHKQESGSLSLLQLNEEPGAGYERVRRGMFLTVDSAKQVEAADSKTYLTLMADLYSRLGAMIGLEAAFPEELSGKVGIGVSRSIFKDSSTGSYTAYYEDPQEGYTSVWNKTTIGTLTLPFRFGIESKLALSGKLASAKGAIEAYSDPYFASDFYDRSVGLDWDRLLGTTTTDNATTASAKTSLNWTAKGEANLGSLLKPYLGTDTASISADFGAFISSKTVSTTGDKLMAVDPSRTFYYPSSITAPTLKLQVKGTALSLSTAKKTVKEETPESEPEGRTPAVVRENPGKGIRTPWDEGSKGGEDEVAPERDRLEESLVLPRTRSDIDVALAERVSTLKLTYSATPQVVVSLPFATTDWAEPTDVDYATSYTLMTAQSGAKVGLEGKLLDGLASLSADLTASGNLPTRYAGTAEVAADAWAAYLLGDYKATTLTLKETTTASLQPFIGVASLKESSLKYALGWQVLATSYESLLDGEPIYVTTAGDFDAETVTAHTLAASVVYKPRETAQSLTFTAVLPPEDASLSGQAKLAVWKLSTSVGLGMSKGDDGTWTPDDISATEVFTPLDWLSLTETATFDAERGLLSGLTTKLKLDDFNAVFEAKRLKPVDPFGTATGEAEAFLPSDLTLQYSLPKQTLWLWKNRIAVEASLSSSWKTNLQAFTDSKLMFSLDLSVSIYKFLKITLSEKSYNNRMYQYIPAWAEEIGANWVNPVTDLLKSFNFFRISDRYGSGFKVKGVSLSVVHEMKDWNLQLEYSGAPALTTLNDGSKRYEWQRTFSMLLQWKPLKLIKAEMKADADGVTYGE